MMTADCPVCSHTANGEKEISCDFCRDVIHSTCSGLTRNEIQCLKAKDRKISFYCKKCVSIKTQMSQLGKIIDKVASLETKVEELTDLLAEKTFRTNDLDLTGVTEDVISELQERQKREKNIVMFNVAESNADSVPRRRSDDAIRVTDYIESLNVPEIDLTDFKIFRLGKPLPNTTRPIKVILRNPQVAKLILKNKMKSNCGIRVYSDQTLVQREHLKKVQTKLKHLVDNGDRSKTIKYVNNVPKLVSVTNGSRQSLN